MKKTFSQVRENLNDNSSLNDNRSLSVPIGQTYDRDLMPQITDPKAFIEYLRSQSIPFDRKKIDSNTLKATQMNFDMNKVQGILASRNFGANDPIFTSNDNQILDGHHRWIANYYSGRPTDCHVVDLPILELMRVAKEHLNNSDKMNEEITHKDFGPMLDSFVSFASDKLGIKSLPNIRYKDSNEDFSSFGGYNPSEKSIVIATKNRHPMDIYRTLAHELVHYKQDKDGRIKDVSQEGSTGSGIENEANAIAGQIMRWYAKANPDMFKQSALVEEEGNQEPLDFDQHFNKTFRITEPEGDATRPGFSIVTPENGDAWSGPNAWKDRHTEGGVNYVDIARENFNKPGWLGRDKYDQITIGSKEQKSAIFVVGVPCSGKDTVILNLQESLMELNYYQEIDIQTIEKKKQLAENLIISGSANNFDEIKRARDYLSNRGYITEMVFVDVPNRISKLRNEQRATKGQRVINESIRFKKYEQSKSNLNLYEKLFDTIHLVINEEGLHQWFKSKSKDGKRGWVQIGGEYEGKPCARQPGQTSTPKCRSSSEASKMTKEQKKYAFNKKQREDPNQPKKSGAAKPTKVETYKKMNEEKDACYHKVKARYKVWPSAYASGALVKCRKKGAANWGKNSVKEATNVNRENQITDVDKQFTKFLEKNNTNDNRSLTDNSSEIDTYKREEGTKALANLYKKGTPGQWDEADCGCETTEGVLKTKNEDILDTASGAIGLPVSDSVGPEFGITKTEMGLSRAIYPYGTYGISESVMTWANKPETIQRFNKKYGKLAEQKLLETVKVINESITTEGVLTNKDNKDMPKSVTQLRESPEGRAGRDMGTVSYSHAEDKVNEERPGLWANIRAKKARGKRMRRKGEEGAPTEAQLKSAKGLDEDSPAWQRKEGKDPEGGLNKKGIASYRRANPGSKLSMAVTTDPSKLKPGSKKAKRRLSFCRRMKGMKEKLTSAKTAGDPDSRINKSLRKWNCE